MRPFAEGWAVTNSSIERRAHKRVRSSIEIVGGPLPGGATARMIASNLSLGGVMCTTSTDYPEMTRLAVRLMLPLRSDGVRPVDVEAVVVRRRVLPPRSGDDDRFELALLFTRFDDTERRHLASFIRANASA